MTVSSVDTTTFDHHNSIQATLKKYDVVLTKIQNELMAQKNMGEVESRLKWQALIVYQRQHYTYCMSALTAMERADAEILLQLTQATLVNIDPNKNIDEYIKQVYKTLKSGQTIGNKLDELHNQYQCRQYLAYLGIAVDIIVGVSCMVALFIAISKLFVFGVFIVLPIALVFTIYAVNNEVNVTRIENLQRFRMATEKDFVQVGETVEIEVKSDDYEKATDTTARARMIKVSALESFFNTPLNTAGTPKALIQERFMFERYSSCSV